MSTEQELMNAALDGIVGDEGVQTDNIVQDDPAPDNDAENVNAVADDEQLPGFKTYDEWIGEGGDPDEWQGKKKYSEHYDLIQNNKEFKGQIREMNDLLRQTVDATTSMQQESYERGLAEAKQQLDRAVEEEDVEAVMKARDNIDQINNRKPAPNANQPNPIHSEFFSNNQIVDRSSGQFNAEVMDEFSRIYNGKLKADGVSPTDQLPKETIHRYMNAALSSAKSLFPDAFESPRNKRAGANNNNGKRTITKPKASNNIKNIKVTTKNPRDNNAVMDVYEAIKKRDPKQAEAFAEKMFK